MRIRGSIIDSNHNIPNPMAVKTIQILNSIVTRGLQSSLNGARKRIIVVKIQYHIQMITYMRSLALGSLLDLILFISK